MSRIVFHVLAAWAMVSAGWAVAQITESWALRALLGIVIIALYAAADFGWEVYLSEREGE